MRSRLAVAVALAGILTACGSSAGSTGVPAERDGHVEAPPPGPEQEAALVQTAEGIARIRVFIEHPRTIGQDERVSFRFDQGGEVPVVMGDGFAVERWDGEAWKEVDRREHPDDHRTLAGGERTDPTVWPVASAEGHDLEPGWYRIGMSASVDGPDGDRELVAHGRFEVRSPAWAAPPDDQYEGVVWSETRQGIAAVELVVEPREVAPDGEVSIRLVNRGDVTLTTGYGYTVERWDEGAWVRPPDPDGVGGFRFSIGVILRPGEDTASRMRGPETWPRRSLDPGPVEPGWYRVVKSASTEGSGPEDPSVDLAARALFHVEP